MNRATEFAKTIVDIPNEDLSIIKSTKTLLFSEKVPWVKKERDSDFDVPMGCYDGAEVCEIVGSYILKFCIRFILYLAGLYKDDGLAIVRNVSDPEIKRKRKAIVKLFKECGLNITIQTNLKLVNFLDFEMKLDTSTYRPYRKTDNIPVYINRKSNHPPTIIEEITKAIAKRISDISSSEVVFNESIPIYSEALIKSGFHGNIKFIPKTTYTKTNKKKTLKCKIVWFNPPYCLNVKTKVGGMFLKLIK